MAARMTADSPFKNLSPTLKPKRVILPHKNEDLLMNFKREEEGAKQDEDEKVELEPFSLMMRTLLLPLLLPMIVIYLTCAQRNTTQVKAEIHALRVEEYKAAHPDLTEEEGSTQSLELPYDSDEEDVKSLWELIVEANQKASITLRQQMNNMMNCLNSKPHRQRQETTYSTRLGTSSRRLTVDRFMPAIDVARTDRVVFPYDGVYVGNIFVDIKDTSRLKALLQKQLETEENVVKNDQNMSVESIIQEITTNTRSSLSPQILHTQPKSQTVAATTISTTSLLSQETAGTTSKSKPKKQPPSDGILRVNPDVAAKVPLQGPSVDHLDQALSALDSPESPLRAKIRQQRRSDSPTMKSFLGGSDPGSPFS